jgi:hypothetical protein
LEEDATDKSFEVTEPFSNYDEVFKKRQYILELNAPRLTHTEL